jgi:hypothetical protein
MVLEPHSMSARPLATTSKRDCTVTGTQFTLSPCTLSWRSIELTTRLHSSITKPSGCLPSRANENGTASARYPMAMVLVSAIFFKRPSSAWAWIVGAASAAVTTAVIATSRAASMSFPFVIVIK